MSRIYFKDCVDQNESRRFIINANGVPNFHFCQCVIIKIDEPTDSKSVCSARMDRRHNLNCKSAILSCS